MVRNILTPTLAGGLSEDHLFLIRLFLSFFDLDRPKISFIKTFYDKLA